MAVGRRRQRHSLARNRRRSERGQSTGRSAIGGAPRIVATLAGQSPHFVKREPTHRRHYQPPVTLDQVRPVRCPRGRGHRDGVGAVSRFSTRTIDCHRDLSVLPRVLLRILRHRTLRRSLVSFRGPQLVRSLRNAMAKRPGCGVFCAVIDLYCVVVDTSLACYSTWTLTPSP